MLTVNKTAELYFPHYRLSLFGTVSKSAASEAVIKLTTVPTAPGFLRSGLSMTLTSFDSGQVLVIDSHVAAEKNGHLYVVFNETPKFTQRRESDRFNCELSVHYRAIRPDRSYGAWRDAITADISLGGVALVCEGHIQFPPVTELQILLPCNSEMVCADPTIVIGTDANGPVRATAKTRHCVWRPDGKSAIGAMFTAMPPVTKLRLVRYVENLILRNY